MSNNNDIRSAGLKVTHARKRILEVLETGNDSHLSADDINRILIPYDVVHFCPVMEFEAKNNRKN